MHNGLTTSAQTSVSIFWVTWTKEGYSIQQADKIISVDSAKALVSEYNNKSGVLTAQLTAVVQEAAKIF